MSILSDKSIRARCQLPERFFDGKLYQRLLDQVSTWPLAGHAVDNIRRDLREKATRAYTAEELAAYKPMIEPFIPEQVRRVRDEGGVWVPTTGGASPVCGQGISRKVISYGLSSYGYDIRLTEDIKLFTNVNTGEIDPLRFDEQGCLVDAEVKTTEDGARYVRIPPNSYLLGSTVEYFRIPKDIMVVCLGKSTYARCGAIVNVTPIEPGFEGNVVIEISNSTPLPMRIYIDQGIGQFMFFEGDEPCEVSYADRAGKYQGQTGVTLPRA